MPVSTKRLTIAAKLWLFFFVATTISLPEATAAQPSRRVIAVFAHPDDERVVGPLLSRLAREGREVHLVVATDGSKGVRDHAGIPAGPQLSAARTREAQCAAKRLGVRQLHMVGLEDGSLGTSMTNLAELRTRLSKIIARVQPEVIITFGPEGGTGHPDHRLVGNVTTEIVQRDERYRAVNLFYASLPTERLRSAPPSMPTVSGVTEDLLTTRVPIEPQDLIAGRKSFACHATQYTAAEMEAINRTLMHVWNGFAYLRPSNGPLRDPSALFRR
jgi:LmbE family N-acetylglucosaminyl deacetylase